MVLICREDEKSSRFFPKRLECVYIFFGRLRSPGFFERFKKRRNSFVRVYAVEDDEDHRETENCYRGYKSTHYISFFMKFIFPASSTVKRNIFFNSQPYSFSRAATHERSLPIDFSSVSFILPSITMGWAMPAPGV